MGPNLTRIIHGTAEDAEITEKKKIMRKHTALAEAGDCLP